MALHSVNMPYFICAFYYLFIWISIINNATMNILIHALYQVHYAFLFGLNLAINFLGNRIHMCSSLADHAKLFSFQLCVSPSWSIFSHFNLTNKQQQQQQITVRGLAQRKRTLIRSLEYDLTWTFFPAYTLFLVSAVVALPYFLSLS